MRTALQGILIALLSLAGCAPSDGGPTLAQSGKERVTSPNVAASDLAELVNGNTMFAFDLYRFLRKEKDGNLFYSPYSISLALAMTYAGARGETERQMANTLHFTLPQDRLHPAFNSLDLDLASRGKGGRGFQLNIVNAIWGQQGYKFLPTFLDVLAENYGAGLRLLDFASDPEASRVTINDWVSDQTNGRIKDLIPQGIIDALTRLVLTNAIYFKAAWAEPFDVEQTRDGPFYLLDGGQVTVPMMSHVASFGYAEGEGYQAVELPYDGRELAMVIFLPAAGKFEEFENSLDVGKARAIVESLSYKEVALTMPRFKVESGFSLAKVLSAMGMPAAFSRGADFSGMDGTLRLYIREVMHKAFVSVDEEGTEAAAATAVIMKEKGLPSMPVKITVNRPFIFLIRDIKTGTILFVGRVVNPAA
jgi:serpin B